MRLGGPLADPFDTPERYVAAAAKLGFAATFCPVGDAAADDTVAAYAAAAASADVVIAEVGAWSNPISADPAERAEALALCQRRLPLAERIGARCCVNIAGSRGPKWDGPHADNASADTFDLIVETVREIIDAVAPTRTAYTLEPMPWVPPDSPDSYLELLRAVDRPAFGVHLDPVNMIHSPPRYYGNADFLRECFAKLGPHIRSVHAKDIALSSKLTTHLDECRPGTGGLDYRTFLAEMDKLPPDTPILLEHLPDAEACRLAADHVRAVAAEIGVSLTGA